MYLIEKINPLGSKNLQYQRNLSNHLSFNSYNYTSISHNNPSNMVNIKKKKIH